MSYATRKIALPGMRPCSCPGTPPAPSCSRSRGYPLKRAFLGIGQRLVAGVPSLWLLVLFAIPFLIVLKISFSEVRLAVPPFAPLLENGRLHPHLSNYAFLFTDPLYVRSFLYSLQVAAVS